MPFNAGKTRQFPEEIQQRMRAYSFYARDRWQVNSKLTVNYGLRYENFPFPHRVVCGLEIYDFTNNTMKLCGLGPNSSDCGITNGKGRPTPRAGIAYRLNDTMVIRAGYGMTRRSDQLCELSRLNYPDLSQQVLNATGNGYAMTLRQGFPVAVAPNLEQRRDSGSRQPQFDHLRQRKPGTRLHPVVEFTVEKQFKSWIASGWLCSHSIRGPVG